MKISKKSWHYRFLLKVGALPLTGTPISLCSYFWRLAGILLFYGVMACVVVGLFVVLGIMVYQTPETLLYLFLALVSVVAFVAVILGGFYAHYRLAKKPPGLVRSWLKAKKDKVCPLIEFTDE